jgi:hypothetical protein
VAGGLVGVVVAELAYNGHPSTSVLTKAFISGAAMGLWNTYGRYIARLFYGTSVGQKLICLMAKNKYAHKGLEAAQGWMTTKGYL